jgi:hypothetical protein
LTHPLQVVVIYLWFIQARAAMIALHRPRFEEKQPI